MSQPVSREPSSSRAPSRARGSRNSSRASLAYLPQGPEDLLLTEGAIGEEAAELLQEFVHPHQHEAEHIDVEEDESDVASDVASTELRKEVLWYKRPSPLWFLLLIPFAGAATAATLAPRIDIYTQLACAIHKPEYTIGRGSDGSGLLTLSQLSVTFSSEDERRLCAKDPVVQAAVAKLSMAMTLTLGILSCLTGGWWGSLSDRFGRKRVLSFSVFGVLVTDVVFLIVYRYYTILPGGYWFLLLGPLLDGLLGAIHAYIADCTDATSRTRMFSLFVGLLFIGIGLGPTLGGIIVHLTGSVISVFYFVAVIHIFYSSIIWFLIPESLSTRRQMEARRKYKEQLEEVKRAPKGRGPFAYFRRSFGFLSPLALFYPAPVMTNGSPLKRPRRDWSLLLVATAYGTTLSVMGSYSYKFQYISSKYGWSSEQLGYWLSVVGGTRAVFLTIMLPLIIKFIKSKPRAPIQLPVSPSEPLEPGDSPSLGEAEPLSADRRGSHSLSFDLGLARASLVVEVISYTLLPFAPTAMLFTVCSMMGAFGAGFSPAMQSVALGLYTQSGGTESGKLFGAMSVVQALSSQILGPALYGMTFMATVETLPTAIFFLSSGAVTIALVCLVFVRLTKGEQDDMEALVFIPEGCSNRATQDSIINTDVPIIIIEEVSSKPSSPAPTPSS
ncbi:hypothetical protein EW026_g6843 [Hermanssonia centrifuga]|uniref:MFS general substrate transporter n=1 Tax=Hermanssonia centrifuga TaxID=98765 RepID=A0A4S4K9Q8_9APHY|nr:hypothetical protein EW026_g6843 [Hermanssonia centrifuga]